MKCKKIGSEKEIWKSFKTYPSYTDYVDDR